MKSSFAARPARAEGARFFLPVGMCVCVCVREREGGGGGGGGRGMKLNCCLNQLLRSPLATIVHMCTSS